MKCGQSETSLGYWNKLLFLLWITWKVHRHDLIEYMNQFSCIMEELGILVLDFWNIGVPLTLMYKTFWCIWSDHDYAEVLFHGFFKSFSSSYRVYNIYSFHCCVYNFLSWFIDKPSSEFFNDETHLCFLKKQKHAC